MSNGFEVQCDGANNFPADVDSRIVNVTIKAPLDSPLGRKLNELEHQRTGRQLTDPPVITLHLDEESLRQARRV